jgi:hypothetical protein
MKPKETKNMASKSGRDWGERKKKKREENKNCGSTEMHVSIMSGYHVKQEDIQAAIAYAADLAEERHVSLEQKVR